ncbi:TadG family pilus assembly protein [Desulfosediminicola sp.]|uniref:TadG family pilus assembly protein n=1 Tax=Desulfosediminicola sp. TaxID=2886825 RepID=UPI003AF22111
MKSRFFPGLTPGREDGAVLIFVVLAILLMFVALTALAIDSGHMVMVRNELQNSADAGALAGAGVLFNRSDGSISPGANDEAEDVARENPAAGADRAKGSSATDKLEVKVQRGHWSFSTLSFTENNNTDQLSGWEGMTAEDLDVNTDFINAVKVTTTREHTKSIFAGFMGQFDHKIETDAVAYLGFASTIDAGEIDIPFALCLEYLTMGSGEIACGVARAVNEGVETGGWTNFSQDGQESFPDGCESTNTNYVDSIVLGDIDYGDCTGINPDPLDGGEAIGTINGNVQTIFSKIVEKCFIGISPSAYNSDTYYQNNVKYQATMPWKDVTFPVVICGEGNYAGGACDETKVTYHAPINVDIIWMSAGKDNVPVKYDVPSPLKDNATFECSDPTNNTKCWQEFQDHYGWDFDDPDGDGLPENNGMYLAPNCDYVPGAGSTGSYNTGIMAAIPVLVE